MSEEMPVTDTKSSGSRMMHVLLGLGLMLPASIACIISMVIPTVSTFNASMLNWSGLGDGEPIGFGNYNQLFSDGRFSQALSSTVAMIVARLLIVAVLPLLLALGVNAFGRVVRIPVRLAFTVPLALYAPVAIALSWGLALSPANGLVEEPLLGDPLTAGSTVLLVDGLFVLGLATGLGLIVYLAALRGPGDATPTFGQVRRPLLVAWVIGLLAAIASTLQAFDFTWLLTRGGPIGSSELLATYQYRVSFTRFQLGFGAASAAPSLLAVLLLGLLAGLIVVLAGLRLEHVSAGKSSFKGSKGVFGAILFLALLCGIAGCLLNASAIPAGLSAGAASPAVGAGPDLTLLFGRGLLLNTVVVQCLSVLLLQIPLTYLAALGIGALRPLGRHSEWLLALFSPWLFMTAAPMLVGLYSQMRSAGLIDTLAGLAGPFMISVPILFVLTLFFKGREQPYQEAVAAGRPAVGAFFGKVIGPSLPLTLLLALAAILVGMQRYQWPLIIVNSEELFTMPVMLVMLAGQYGNSPAVLAQAIASTTVPIFLLFLIAFGVFQVFYLDRLALCGPSGSSEDPQAAPVHESLDAGPSEQQSA